MAKQDFGAIVARRGMPSQDPWAAGQEAETYVLLDRLVTRTSEPVDGEGIPWDAHGWAVSQAPRLASEIAAGRTREHRRHRCRCKRAPSVATEYVDPTGTIWVVVGPERVPAAFRRSPDFDPETRAFPLHNHPNGTVHVEITTCRRCNQDWAVGISGTGVQIARVKATRGAIVAP